MHEDTNCHRTSWIAQLQTHHILKTQPAGVHRQCTRADKQLSLNVKHHCYGGDEAKMVSVNCVAPVLLSWFIMLIYGWRLMLLFLSCKPLFLFQSLHAFCFLSLFICHLLWLLSYDSLGSSLAWPVFKYLPCLIASHLMHLQRHPLVSLFCIRFKAF